MKTGSRTERRNQCSNEIQMPAPKKLNLDSFSVNLAETSLQVFKRIGFGFKAQSSFYSYLNNVISPFF